MTTPCGLGSSTAEMLWQDSTICEWSVPEWTSVLRVELGMIWQILGWTGGLDERCRISGCLKWWLRSGSEREYELRREGKVVTL